MIKIAANKDQAMLDWISSNPQGIPVMFNFLSGDPDSYAFVPSAAEAVVKRYINGSARKRYDFAFQLMRPMSQTTDNVNLESMYIMRQWQEWIDEQERTGNYPDFGPACSDYRLENLSNGPQLAMSYTEDQMAKYQFMATLYYLEEK